MQNETGKLKKSDGLTKRVLDIDWLNYFPLLLSSHEEIRESDHKTVLGFMNQNGNNIFNRSTEENGFMLEKHNPAKTNFYDEAGDFFVFLSHQEIVGTFVGNVSDWSTYYLRSCAIIPEFQGRGYFSKFLQHLISVLKKHGVKRVEGDVSPSNIAEVHLFNKLNFNVTGYRASDRWGSVIHFTKFIDEENEVFFLDRFCDGVRPQLERTAHSLIRKHG
jgi:ribosomal protein S18 acetylase RimI-like enzyme